jgi:hypothetical protein
LRARGSTRDPSDSSNCPSTTTFSSPDSSAITDVPWKVRSTFTGWTLATPSLDHEHVAAVPAALHRHRRHHHRILGADDELGRNQIPGHKVSRSLFMMPRTVTMPVVESTEFSTIATLPSSDR